MKFVNEIKRNYLLYIMILPAVLFFIIFHYIPMAGIVLAFKKFNYVQGIFRSPWVGVKNFEFLFKSGALFNITKNTILYNLAFIVVGVIMQLTVAIMLAEITSKIFKKTFQSLMFLPHFVSYVLVGAMVYSIFNYERGMLNSFLTAIGLDRINVYTIPSIWKYILVFFNQWKGLGYGVIIYMAAITSISTEYYEAAKIDGANKWHEIRNITLPLLKPTVIVIVLFAVGRIMKGQFELFYQLIGRNGQLYHVTDIIDTYVVRAITETFDTGMGTAAGLYQSLFGFLLIITVNYVVKKVEPDYALF